MNKPNKRDGLNLIFSAFLIFAYIICAYFFLTMSATIPALESYLNVLVFAIFGLVIFYATRVGEGKPVKRFSLATLILLDIPALYVILAQLIPALPLHTMVANLGGTTPFTYSPLFILACVALGYGIPYTFLSGFEMVSENAAELEEITEDTEVIEIKGEFVITDADTEGALLVVDDEDTAFDVEKEIRFSDVENVEGAKIGSYVIFVASDVDIEDEEEATEEVSEESVTEE